jgi:hypothetical protein
MCGTGIDLEAEIYDAKLANETSPWTPMHGIKGELVKNSAYRLRNLWRKTIKLANETWASSDWG